MYQILVMNWQDITNPQGGGAEVHLHEIFKRIAARGHHVTLLCCQHAGASAEEVLEGIHIIRRGRRELFNFIVPQMYRQLRRQQRFDVVFDDINKIPFYSPLFVKEPLIGIIHHLFGKTIYQEVSFLPASYVYWAEKLIPRIYRKIPIMAVSPSSKEELIEKGLEVDAIEIITNGVDCQRYQPGLQPKSPQPLVGYLGRIKRYKCVEHLLYAFKAVQQAIPATRLILVGDGDHLSELKKLAGQLQLSKSIEFTGFVSESEKILMLNQIWLCVNPSPKEGWGVSVIEANACGTPVIAANSPGLRDSVVDLETGRLYPFGEIHELARMIIDLIQDQPLRQKLGEKARTWAEKFDWDHSAQLTLALIERTIASSKKFS